MKHVFYALIAPTGYFKTHSTSWAMPALYKTYNTAKRYNKSGVYNIIEVTLDTENVITDAKSSST